ncbi:MAG: TIGR00159 family protein [Haliscomenobacter sp.]|nr:TIGR00159 family protein [Haliscomenobacter sp.]
MIVLFKIGFLPLRIWDVLDILIVAYLMYQIYRLLRGNIAFNILLGLLIFFVIYGVVNQLGMDLLAAVLGQFVSVGVIIIVIIFQQEIRRFLFYLGNSTLRQRSRFLRRILDRRPEPSEGRERYLRLLKGGLLRLSRQKTGALVVLTKDIVMEEILATGVLLEAAMSEQILESIFNKLSPLHDGAVLIRRGRLLAAGCILPVSENQELPQSAGLRHRAAVGVTERFDAAAIVVSEETGHIAFAYGGKLFPELESEEVEAKLREHLM